MQDGPVPGGIPVIGRLRPLELAGFVGLALAAGASVSEALAEPVFPALLVYASVALSSTIAFVVLLVRVRRRLRGYAETAPGPIDPAALARHSEAMTASLIVQAACTLFPLFADEITPGAAAALLFTILASGFVFLVSLGILAARLGRSWKLWVGLTVITPFGPFIAYFMMRKLLKQATRKA